MKFTGEIDRLQVQNLRGHVDVYEWFGLKIARKWPRKQKSPRTKPQEQTRENMRKAMRWAWGTTKPNA